MSQSGCFIVYDFYELIMMDIEPLRPPLAFFQVDFANVNKTKLLHHPLLGQKYNLRITYHLYD